MMENEGLDFDERSITIGDCTDTTDRIPTVDVYLKRCGSHPDARKLAELIFVKGGITATLVGLTVDDLQILINFFSYYEQRMRDC